MIDPRRPDFRNTPASLERPRFTYLPTDPAAPPCVSIVTPFYNAGPEVLETAHSVLNQSLQQFEWLIVDDGSTRTDSLALLDRLRSTDPRIRIIQHPRNQGLSAARNTGFREARAAYVLQLDSDDLIEPTAAEKWFWALESHPEYAFVKGYTVGFGGQEYLWNRGFHEGAGFLSENLVAATSLVRRLVHEQVGGYDERNRGGLEDWEFWLRCASRGHWGGTVPEYLDWYRRRPSHSDRWDNLHEGRPRAFLSEMRTRYPGLWESFPRAEPKWHMPNEAVSDELPCSNGLCKVMPRALMVVPWLTMGGADRFNLDLIRQLRARDWEVTVATTVTGDHTWLPEFARLTPDIFPLPHFVRLVDYPRVLRYLIHSRSVDVVVITNSEMAYHLLPFLRAHAPGVTFVDFCHMEEEAWKSGGYPRLSVEYRNNLDLQVVSSQHLKNWMVHRGADSDRIEVCYTGIDSAEWRPDPEARARKRRELGVREELPVVLYAARICPQKQPRVFARTMQLLAARGIDFLALVAGDGPDLPWLRRFVHEHDLGAKVRLLGSLPAGDYRELLGATDVFFLPSEWEGIALSIYEAMASGVPVVGSAVGGQPELVTPETGVLLPRADEESEASRYADTLATILSSSSCRDEMAHNARQRVVAGFKLTDMGDRMVALFDRGTDLRQREPRAALSPGMARTVAFQAVEYVRLFQLSEWLWSQRNHMDPRVRAYHGLVRVFEPAYRWGVRRGWQWLSVVRARVKLVLMGRR